MSFFLHGMSCAMLRWLALFSVGLLASAKADDGVPRLAAPTGLALDESGRLFISDAETHRIYKLGPGSQLTVVAGTGNGAFSGDDGAAAQAALFAPHDLAFDRQGNLYVADSYNHRVRRINSQGVISTVAGNGKSELSGDGGQARLAALNSPQGIALDAAGNLLIADTFNHVVRRVGRDGNIRIFAGTEAGLAGDGGPAAKAQISLPTAVAAGADGAVYIADSGNNRIRRVDASGIIHTVLGFGPGSGTAGAGFAGDGGPAEKGRIFGPADVKVSALGHLYVSDSGNNRIRLVAHGVVATVAGSGVAGFNADDGPALRTALFGPQKMALGADGTVFIADRANHRVRKMDSSGMMTSIAGVENRPPKTRGALE